MLTPQPAELAGRVTSTGSVVVAKFRSGLLPQPGEQVMKHCASIRTIAIEAKRQQRKKNDVILLLLLTKEGRKFLFFFLGKLKDSG